jgi:vacuolar protein-sorting-associated protein 4
MNEFKQKAMECAKKAVEADKEQNYEEAMRQYGLAVEFFVYHNKYDKIQSQKEIIDRKCREYLARIKDLKDAVNGQQNSDGGNGPNGSTAATLTGAKTKGKDEELQALKAAIGDAILEEKPDVKWEDVAGLESAKEALKEAVILPVKYPQFFTGKRKPWSGILLYGPPGTGKSYLAKAIATEADSTFFSVSSSDLVSKWMGESEKLVSSLFALAREKAPSIIFIDEIDALCSSRGDGESEAARRIKTEFLVQMNGVARSGGNGTSEKEKRVLLLGATNLPYSLDHAVRRRFDKRIHIPLPEARDRAQMFRIHVGDTPHELIEEDFKELGEQTRGFSGSDIAVVVKDILMQPIRKTQDATHFKRIKTKDGEALTPCSPGDKQAFEATLGRLADEGKASMVIIPPISMVDCQKVLLRARPTVSAEDLELYSRFTQEFGEEG